MATQTQKKSKISFVKLITLIMAVLPAVIEFLDKGEQVSLVLSPTVGGVKHHLSVETADRLLATKTSKLTS